MALDMLHHNTIARAIRLLCQSAVSLSIDTTPGENQVQVGSNELFKVGDNVVLRDSAGSSEHVVDSQTGLAMITLTGTVGDFQVNRGARLQLASPRLPDLAWVGQGSPELLPRAPTEQFPCVLVMPGEMRQPFNAGGNRVFQQEYTYHVFYVEEYSDGQSANLSVLGNAETLFNLLMQDTYLGGTCWHSQVTAVDPAPTIAERLREQERPLRVAELTLVAKRAAVWNP